MNPPPTFYNKYLSDKEYCLYFRKFLTLWLTSRNFWTKPTWTWTGCLRRSVKLLIKKDNTITKKIIEGKTYNTKTALFLGDWQYLWKSDYRYCREELYRTRKGTYFIYGEGGALSCYARYIGGSATGDADFQVLSDREAKEWAEKKLSAEEYCKIFGEPEEG